MPRDIIDDARRRWSTPLPDGSQLALWSNDWERFSALTRWIAPATRWSTRDLKLGLFEDVVSQLRVRLNILGDPIPFAYQEDPERVVFKVGKRMYVVTLYKDDEEKIGYGMQFGATRCGAAGPFDGHLLDHFVPASTNTILFS